MENLEKSGKLMNKFQQMSLLEDEDESYWDFLDKYNDEIINKEENYVPCHGITTEVMIKQINLFGIIKINKFL